MTGPHNRTCGARAVLCGITALHLDTVCERHKHSIFSSLSTGVLPNLGRDTGSVGVFVSPDKKRCTCVSSFNRVLGVMSEYVFLK
jgi:hypothetical protein